MDSETSLFICFKEPGPNWAPGISTREQALWNEHAEFIDNLFDSGRIALAGPYADWSGAMVIVRATSAEEAKSMFDADPWATEDMLHVVTVKPWIVFLNGLE